ncbi:MAG: hypothetical protein PVS2B1_17060 [Candidatus Dormibacteraceae bacterium]
MKSLLALLGWMVAISAATFGLMFGLTGIVFGSSKFVVLLAGDCSLLSCYLGAIAFERISALSVDLCVDVMTDVHRVRNWRRRRSWRALAAALAGQSTAASFTPYR